MILLWSIFLSSTILTVFSSRSRSHPGVCFFHEHALYAHDVVRRLHGAGPLQHDVFMSTEATMYAQKLVRMGYMQHASRQERRNDGENLAYRCTTSKDPLSPLEVVRWWYEEVCNPGYDFNSGVFSAGTGHFTQMVWANSKKFGIGFAVGKRNGMTCTYVVARYRPAGNMMNNFKQNVLRGGWSPKLCGTFYDRLRDGVEGTCSRSSLYRLGSEERGDVSRKDEGTGDTVVITSFAFTSIDPG